jgi:tetraacyldisaccharide 4'-kinase
MLQRILFRVLLSPLALLYGMGVSIINVLYDTGFLKASRFNIPVISVGNLSIGGAGKTPHIEYLIEMLSEYIYVATLSRGYKRITKGFRFVTWQDTALTAGDEPMQYRKKYRDIVVAVSESRAYAIPQILKDFPQTQLILLDDAFQHRAVQPGLNILLTAYDALFTDDYLLPAGRLREWRSSYKRADMIIVSKCPPLLSETARRATIEEIRPLPHQTVFFSYYSYGHPFHFHDSDKKILLDDTTDVILLSAIANTSYLMQYVENQVAGVIQIEFSDHHLFDKGDIEKIIRVYHQLDSTNKLVLTTEKDAMRLALHSELIVSSGLPLYVLPAKVQFHFDEGKQFQDAIHKYLLHCTV